MKALVFTTQFHIPSGAEKLSIQLAKELLLKGYDVELLSMYERDSHDVISAEKKLRILGIENIKYLGLNVNPGIIEIIVGIFRLRKKIKMHKYDFIETSLLGPMIIASWATLMLRIKLLGGIHAVYSKEMHNTKKHKIWRYTTRIIRKIKLYAISNAAADAWSQYALIPRCKISVIYNAVDDQFFNAKKDVIGVKKELNIPERSRILLFVGSIIMYKGIDTLVEAAGPILEQQNIYIVFVGLGNKAEGFFPSDNNFYDAFYENIKQNSWQDRIKFIGTRDDVARLMASSDLLIHPTRTEGFGLVVAEALAAGLHVIATNVGGIPEVLYDTGSVMIPPGQPVLLREAILSALSLSGSELEALQKKGKKKAEKYRMVKRVEALIELASNC